MANSVHLSQKSKVRRNKQKAQESNITIKSAKYIRDFMIALTFTNSETKLFDFLPIFQKYVKGVNIKYFAPQNFRKFIVKNGNIYWGKNEDIIFPVSKFLEDHWDNYSEEILYII